MQVIHYPRLDTVLMIEETIRKKGECRSKRQLWQSLPKQVMYQTFKLVIDYLQDSNKILIDRDGRVVWIWDPDGVKAFLKRELVVR